MLMTGMRAPVGLLPGYLLGGFFTGTPQAGDNDDEGIRERPQHWEQQAADDARVEHLQQQLTAVRE